jgi:alpha-glucosidase
MLSRDRRTGDIGGAVLPRLRDGRSWLTALAGLAIAIPVQAQYQFLGDLRSFSQVESGVDLHCDPGDSRVEIRFLTPYLVRVTLLRDSSDRRELLDYPIAKTDWDPVSIQIAEEPERIVVRGPALDIAVRRSPCRLTMLDKQGMVLLADDPGMGMGWDGNEVRTWKTIAPDERFYGLGEKTGQLDKRGVEWVMWNSDTYAYGPEQDPIYQSVPFVIAMRSGQAYGLYFNNSYRSVFNLGAGNHRYWSFAADGGAMDYFFIHGPEVASVVERYTDLTGRIPMPPRWSLGLQQSRWSYYPDREVMRIAETYREKKIPADVLYLDIHYMNEYRVFTWDSERFPDPEGMLRRLEEMGFKVVVIIDPGVKEDSAYAVAREGLAGDHFVRYPDGEVFVGSVWPGRSYFPDFSKPQTQEWWGGKLAALIDQGVDGIWNDMNEPAVWGKAFPLEVLMEDGGRKSSQKRMHNLYGYLMSQTAYEQLRKARPGERPFVLTRAGFASEQRFTAVWTGDNVASDDHLALSIRMMLGMGLSGVPVIGADVGGFVGTPTPELFARWIQVGALSPFFRIHTAANTPDQEPWSYGEHVEEIARNAVTMRYRLLPYLYSLLREAHLTGHPILRPIFWHYQQDSLAYSPRFQHQFLVGEHLLVAPVTRQGQYFQEVYLPAGEWLDLATDSVYRGPRTVVVPAPLERVPMFLGAGAIIPMQEPVQHTSERGDSVLTLEVFAGARADTFELYEDDGRTFEYERGAYRTTRLAIERDGAALRFTREVVHDGFNVPERTVVLRVRGVGARPRSATLGGRALSAVNAESGAEGYSYDSESRILTIRFRESGARQQVVVR